MSYELCVIRNKMIGVFDSGLGGLTILKEFLKELPEYDYIYLGDNARAPYGNKSQELIYNYTKEAVDFLFGKGCELVIIACNTVSAKALRRIQQEYLPKRYPQKRVLGVVVPTIEFVFDKVKKNSEYYIKIGVVGTQSTIESGVYQKEINKLCTGISIHGQACPLLVPLIEEGWLKKEKGEMVLKEYLKKLKDYKLDILILGCTHYPILKNKIQEIMGEGCLVIDSSEIIVEKLKDYLFRHNEIENRLAKEGCKNFFTTGDVGLFGDMGKIFLNEDIENIKKI